VTPAADIAIVGGGPAGLSTALGLQRRGHRVVVLERSAYDDVRLGEHLAPSAVAALARLEASAVLDSPLARATPGTCSAWGDPALVFRSDIESPWGLGRTVMRPAFDAALAELAAARGVTVRRGQAVRAVERSSDGWRLALRDGPLTCAVLVDATGRRGWLARRLGARPEPHDALVGVAGRCPARDPAAVRESSLWVEAAEHGWWYSALLPDGSLALVWLTDADALAGREPAAVWHAALETAPHTRERLRGHGPPLRIHVRSARSARLRPAAGRGWLAVGDAAMSWDPLSSSGLARALGGGERAAAAIDAHARGHADALAEHDLALERELTEYLATRTSYYRLETRWPHAPFWARRQRP
jgi:flavin-dependent dehydrogenase